MSCLVPLVCIWRVDPCTVFTSRIADRANAGILITQRSILIFFCPAGVTRFTYVVKFGMEESIYGQPHPCQILPSLLLWWAWDPRNLSFVKFGDINAPQGECACTILMKFSLAVGSFIAN